MRHADTIIAKAVMESDDQCLDPFIVMCLYIQFSPTLVWLEVEQNVIYRIIVITRAYSWLFDRHYFKRRIYNIFSCAIFRFVRLDFVDLSSSAKFLWRNTPRLAERLLDSTWTTL